MQVKQQIDCLGEMCPIPLLRLKACPVLKASGQTVKLITDHSCALGSVSEYCKKLDLKLETAEPIAGVWELYVTKP